MHQTAASQLAHPASSAATLNGDCHSALLDRAALQHAMQAQGEEWHSLVTERCPHLFADVPVFISATQLRQMRAVIEAVERVVALPGWSDKVREPGSAAKGVFFGYDFHLNEQGAHLIEINTNAGGGFLNALLLDSQREAGLPGAPVAEANFEQAFLDMFRNEWRLASGDVPLNSIAIVDEQPEGQYLYAEFLLAKNLFGRAGIAAHIADPAALQARDDGLYLDLPEGGQKIDLVYNRLTDFSLQRHSALRQSCLDGRVVLTPDPVHYARYADKRNLARLTDVAGLRSLGASEADIVTLQAGIPRALVVQPDMEAMLWAERKQWFFKPNSGYGSKGAYRGEKLTRRVFAEILQGDYVAQKLAAPGERAVCVNDAGVAPLKYDVRCYVYDGQVQLVAARLYQGQTTNFRTPGGGFALVRVVE
ncbi:MAG: hypothetical protein HZA59_14840 [Hydrogenophilales bacterium]|nr:hypothetical protein [Hydrogenophilales bacterium]